MGSKKFRARADGGGRLKAPDSSGKGPGQEYPAFSLRYLSRDYCITACEKDEMASFAEKIKTLTQMSWLEVSQAHRHGLGYEKIEQNQIKAAIPPHVTPDTKLLAFRFHGMKPMVGYKDGETFHVLWFDRGFDLYDH